MQIHSCLTAVGPLPALKYYSLDLAPGAINVLSEPVRYQDLQPMMDALVTLFQRYPAMQAYSSRGSIISSNDGGSRAVALDILWQRFNADLSDGSCRLSTG